MIIAFTGAGISKASGIDTFQDRPGIRDKLTRSFATSHPTEYREVMREFVSTIKGKEPNDAHYALAEYKIPIITMNVDGLHQKAGSQNVIALHGCLPNDKELGYCERLYNRPVLYGDPAPNYESAYDMLWLMDSQDILLVVGASDYTNISVGLRDYVRRNRTRVVEIQADAETEVRKFLESHKEYMESYEEYKKREEKWYH